MLNDLIRRTAALLTLIACLLSGGASACAQSVERLDATLPAFLPMDGMGMSRTVNVTGTRYFADYEYLRALNPDIAGWLMQDDIGLSEAILQGSDNDEYLALAVERTPNRYGCVTMDAGCDRTFLNACVGLYASDRESGGAFRTLHLYAQQAYYAAHPQMRLLTPYADYQVDLFACVVTTTDDDTLWRLNDHADEKTYQAFVDGLIERSTFACVKDALPQFGDRLLALNTCSTHLHDTRYVLFGRLRPIVYLGNETQDVVKRGLDERDTQNGWVTVGSLGKRMVYAQNDPLWSGLRYEASDSGKQRPFGDGGCGPTAVAMAIANLVDEDKLPLIKQHARYSLGYTLCECSVNRYYCTHRHPQYQLKTAAEFLRYLPMAVANFATGNNEWNLKSRADFQGTNMRFLDMLCELYGLTLERTHDLDETIEALRLGNCVAVTMVSGGGPFTDTSHYVALVGVDSKYLYMLDPLRRDTYAGKPDGDMPEVIGPGVVRIPLEDAHKCHFYAEYMIRRPAAQ